MEVHRHVWPYRLRGCSLQTLWRVVSAVSNFKDGPRRYQVRSPRPPCRR